MLKIFIGSDERQPAALTSLIFSIYRHASQPVAITPLVLETLPLKRRGLTPFTYSRFLVPYLCNYDGVAIFMDPDMLLRSDICELQGLVDEAKSVFVVKSLSRFEWTSFMMFNCSHPSNRKLTPEYVEKTDDNLHGLSWLSETEIGDLPKHWNQLSEYQSLDITSGNIHYTAGIPAFPETSTCDGAEAWLENMTLAQSIQPWESILGSSVHALRINGVPMPKYVWDEEKETVKEQYRDQVIQILEQNSQPAKPQKPKQS